MKSNTMKFLLLISVVLNVVILGTVGYSYLKTALYNRAQGHGRYQFLIKELSLTPDQAIKMEEKGKLLHEEIIDAKQRMRQKRMELIDLMRSDNPDTKAIAQTISAIGDMQEGVQKKIVLHILEVKASLNKEQQNKFFDLIERFMARKEAGQTSQRLSQQTAGLVISFDN